MLNKIKTLAVATAGIAGVEYSPEMANVTNNVIEAVSSTTAPQEAGAFLQIIFQIVISVVTLVKLIKRKKE